MAHNSTEDNNLVETVEICTSSSGEDIYILGPVGITWKRANQGWFERIPNSALVRKMLEISFVMMGDRKILRCVLGRLAVWVWLERKNPADSALDVRPE